MSRRIFKTITPVLPHLAMANGIPLSPNGSELWATEFSRNLLHRIELSSPTTIATGRVLMFNKNGIPIGQILLPGRDEGHNLESTSMAIKPDTDEIYIVTNDGNGGQGAAVFHARVFAKALPLYSHQDH